MSVTAGWGGILRGVTERARDAITASPGRAASVAGVVGAALAIGVAAGITAERIVVGRVLSEDPYRDEPFGQVRGVIVPVTATDGTLLHVEVDYASPGSVAARAGDDLTVVFCHGFALDQDTWHFQRRDLSGLARLVFWDLRSHGRSARGNRDLATIDQLGRDLAAVVDATCPAGTPVILVGHSMGGMAVMAYANLRPDDFGARVRGAGLVSTSAGGLAEIGFGLPPALARPIQRVMPGVTSALVWQKELVERTRRAGHDAGLALTRAYSFSPTVSATVAELVHRIVWSTPIDVVAEFLPSLNAHDKLIALAALRRVDTVVITGEDDKLIPAAHSEIIAAEIPDAYVVRIPDGGHMALLEFYPEVNAALRDLISRVRSSIKEEAPR